MARCPREVGSGGKWSGGVLGAATGLGVSWECQVAHGSREVGSGG